MANAIRFLPAFALIVLTAGTAAAQDRNFGMPTAEALKAQERCAKLSDSYSAQVKCMIAEKEGYDKMHPLDHSLAPIDPSNEARKARMRAEANYRDPVSVNACPAPYRMTERDGCRR